MAFAARPHMRRVHERVCAYLAPARHAAAALARSRAEAVAGVRAMPALTCVIQIAVAYEWLVSGIDKVASPQFADGLAPMLQRTVYGNPLGWYKWLIMHVAVPNGPALARPIALGETMIGAVLLASAILWLVRPHARWTALLACAACPYLAVAALLNACYFLLDGDSVAWVSPNRAFDSGVHVDALLAVISLSLLVANISALRAQSRASG